MTALATVYERWEAGDIDGLLDLFYLHEYDEFERAWG